MACIEESYSLEFILIGFKPLQSIKVYMDYVRAKPLKLLSNLPVDESLSEELVKSPPEK